jgi:hypothetical protein
VTTTEISADHYYWVADRLLSGRVVPFLGAGANLCDRPAKTKWELGKYLPSGDELAEILAERIRYPISDDLDLLRVAQYVGAVLGEGALYDYLRETFNADYPPTSLHFFLADTARVVRERGKGPMLVLTTNYDDALERAFELRGEPHEVLWYDAKRKSGVGRFMHRSKKGVTPVDRPNSYTAPIDKSHAVILKLHGAIDRAASDGDSYVITEDNYIDYLTRADISTRLPITTRKQLTESHFLFLGYSLRDWNLRVILNRIWGQRALDLYSWAIQLSPKDDRASEIERKLWGSRGEVELLYVPLADYVRALRAEAKVPSGEVAA